MDEKPKSPDVSILSIKINTIKSLLRSSQSKYYTIKEINNVLKTLFGSGTKENVILEAKHEVFKENAKNYKTNSLRKGQILSTSKRKRPKSSIKIIKDTDNRRKNTPHINLLPLLNKK